VNEFIPLQLLPAGQSARVAELLGSPADVQRLQEMGLRQGSYVQMIQGGSPCIIQLAGSRLCLRDANLFFVLVEPVSSLARQPVPSMA
jgi:Fe2+ transport system protein FeoA